MPDHKGGFVQREKALGIVEHPEPKRRNHPVGGEADGHIHPPRFQRPHPFEHIPNDQRRRGQAEPVRLAQGPESVPRPPQKFGRTGHPHPLRELLGVGQILDAPEPERCGPHRGDEHGVTVVKPERVEPVEPDRRVTLPGVLDRRVSRDVQLAQEVQGRPRVIDHQVNRPFAEHRLGLVAVRDRPDPIDRQAGVSQEVGGHLGKDRLLGEVFAEDRHRSLAVAAARAGDQRREQSDPECQVPGSHHSPPPD